MVRLLPHHAQGAPMAHISSAPPVYPELAAEIARQGITAADLGRRVGRSPQTISQIIRGRLRPSDQLRRRIATELDRPEGELFALNADIERLIGLAISQGFGRTINDPATINRLAVLTQ